MSKKTPLYNLHVELGGQIVDFAGYLLPIQYATGIVTEHKAVRTAAGIFDVSHMGEILFEGEEALAALNYICTNSFTNMKDTQARYTLMCYEKGTIVDDILIYKYNNNKYLAVVNASNREKDFLWMKEKAKGFNVEVKDISDGIGQVALQGPASYEIITSLVSKESLPERNYFFKDNVLIGDISCLISATGYTGEKGYEIYTSAEKIEEIYKALLEKGKAFGLLPAGLGCRDTLRLEAGMPLYGHELSDEILAHEVGLDFAIKYDKDFIGKKALESSEPEYLRVGAVVIDRGIVREGAIVYSNDVEVGYVTSGTFIPTLQKAVCVLRLKKEYIDSPLTVKVREKNLKIEAVDLPFMEKK